MVGPNQEMALCGGMIQQRIGLEQPESQRNQFTAFTVVEWDAAWNKDGAKYPHGVFAPTYTADTHMFNWLGWPALSIPCGFVNGLPIGMQIIAKPRREATLYRAAAAFLKAFPMNERPKVS